MAESPSLQESLKNIVEADEEVVEALDDGPVKKQVEQVREIYERGDGGGDPPEGESP